MITKEDWVDWKQHKVTKMFLKAVHDKREALKEGIADGAVEGDELQRTIGRCMSLYDTINFALHELVIEGEEDE
jgi:hypothetical protein